MSRRELEEHIAVCLGGRVAEQLVLGDISTGASSDIQKASSIARNMVTKYGMSEKLGTIAYTSESNEVFIGRTMAQSRSYSEEIAGLIDEEVKSIVDAAYRRCEDILSQHRSQLELTAQYLLAHEVMSGETFQKVFTSPTTRSLRALSPRNLKKKEPDRIGLALFLSLCTHPQQPGGVQDHQHRARVVDQGAHHRVDIPPDSQHDGQKVQGHGEGHVGLMVRIIFRDSAAGGAAGQCRH